MPQSSKTSNSEQVMSDLPHRGVSAHEIQPAQRRRYLTPPPESQSARQYHTQSQCLLLMKLPLELRDLIWHECVGDMIIHLRYLKKSLRRIECPSRDLGRHILQSELYKRRKLLSILLTCRKVQVYREAFICALLTPGTATPRQ
jgi:hypothetical protein